MKRFLSVIDNINDQAGKTISFLVIFVLIVIVIETAARYVFNSPTMWVYETAIFLFAGYDILGGGYVLRHHAHVNMDIIHSRLSPRTKAIVDLITSFFFFLFCGLLLWKGIDFAWRSIEALETTTSAWAPAIYPVKIMIPLGALLILLQGLAKFIRDLTFAISGVKTE